jgi:hypothetical protein
MFSDIEFRWPVSSPAAAIILFLSLKRSSYFLIAAAERRFS